MSADMTAELVTNALMMSLAPGSATRAAASLRSRQPIYERAAADGRARHRLLAVALWQRLGQRSDGKLFLDAEDGADGSQSLPVERCCEGRRYIELFYSPRRRHSTLAYISPVYEEQARLA